MGLSPEPPPPLKQLHSHLSEKRCVKPVWCKTDDIVEKSESTDDDMLVQTVEVVLVDKFSVKLCIGKLLLLRFSLSTISYIQNF